MILVNLWILILFVPILYHTISLKKLTLKVRLEAVFCTIYNIQLYKIHKLQIQYSTLLEEILTL